MRKIPQNGSVSESGFSVVELLVVVAIIAVMATVVLFYASAHKKAYQADEQTSLLTDILQEARQRSLTQRDPLRVEINLTTNTVSLINENTSGTSDDVLLKKASLYDSTGVKVGTAPGEIGVNPPETLPVPTAVFKPSVYPTSISQNVCTIRFMPDGTVMDAGTSATGTGAVVTGITLYVWSPDKNVPTNSSIARGITILGATGAVRLWEWDHSLTVSNKWKDSRRVSSF